MWPGCIIDRPSDESIRPLPPLSLAEEDVAYIVARYNEYDTCCFARIRSNESNAPVTRVLTRSSTCLHLPMQN
jgi:hypothetical protein